ncbi:MAG: hypothetical protein JJU13_00875 [Balneolaceae bacterium]|jgi:hypothetical protein|nr:hypothetical protein [Balneolaceae bacterium]
MYKQSAKLLTIVITLIFSLSTVMNAQQNDRSNSGSFYSGIGFGVPHDLNSPFSTGMGLSGVSNFDSYSANISNPAQWGLISFSQGHLAIGLDQFESYDNVNTIQSANFGIENFQFAFPFLRNRLGASIAFSPVVRSDFHQRTRDFFNPMPDLSSDVEYLIDTVGSGGVNRFEGGLGFRLHNNLTIGYALSANILVNRDEVTPVFSDTQFRGVQYTRKTEGHSLGHRFGVFAYTGSLLRDDDWMSFGATVTLPISIDAERSVTSFRNINNQRRQVDINEGAADRFGTVKLPLEFNTGLTYNLNRFTNVVAELLVQQWGNAEYSYNPTQQEYFKDRVRAGLGFQYHPYRTEQAGGFFSNFRYSLGTTYDTGHLSINGEDIETLFLNAGIGIISQRSASSIDLSVHYGIRGTDSSNLVKENIWGFKLSLNLSENMFVRQRFQ